MFLKYMLNKSGLRIELCVCVLLYVKRGVQQFPFLSVEDVSLKK